MTSKWDQVRGSFRRAHDDLFEPNYTATFYSYSSGVIERGEVTGRERQTIGAHNVEIVPPATDTTIGREGTDLSFSTSIRVPLELDSLTVSDGDTMTIASAEVVYYDTVTVEAGGTLTVDGTLVTTSLSDNGTVSVNGTLSVLSEAFYDSLDAPGDGVTRPTEVEISDSVAGESETYQVHAYSEERGSGFVMIRLEEL